MGIGHETGHEHGALQKQEACLERQALKIQVIRCDPALELPKYHYLGDAGLDLCAAKDVQLAPNERKMVATGIKVAIPFGYAGFVLPRSGLAAKSGLTLVNSPGLIDSQYRGEICCICLNTDAQQAITIKRGDRIAQLVVLAVAQVSLVEVDDLDETLRGTKGFGSSGL